MRGGKRYDKRIISNKIDKGLKFATAFLPFVFLIHNIEELWTVALSDDSAIGSHIANIYQFAIAVSLFTILGFILIFKKGLWHNAQQYNSVVIGFAGMLFLNSFFPHISISILQQAYTPGLISATVLVLPITTYILWKNYSLQLLSTKRFIATIVSGGLIGLLLVFVFLGIGYLLTKNF